MSVNSTAPLAEGTRRTSASAALFSTRLIAALATPAVAVPLTVWIGSGLYLWMRLDRGWYPWDEGTLAEPAVRILSGELPHRDFVDAYSGALSYLHAAAFVLFGRELTSLRLVLFAFFVAWVPSLYYVASRFLRPPEAGGVALVAIAWSVPNYPASMPSWYCTFLATFGISALFRHLETGRRRWIFVAGLCAGLSIAVKIVGIYFVAAALLYFAFKASSGGRRPATRAPAGRRSLTPVVAVMGVAFLVAALGLVRAQLNSSVIVNFVVPVVGLACFAVLSARRGETSGSASLGSFMWLVTPFAAGVVIPVGILATAFLASGAIGDLVRGVWPSSRLTYAALSPPSLFTLALLIPLVPVFWVPRNVREANAWHRAIPIAAVATFALMVSQKRFVYVMTWQSVRAIVPVLTIGGLIAIHRRRSAFCDPRIPQRLMLLLASAAMCSLVQYPYSAPVYFAYVAPLVIVAAAALIVEANLLPRPILWILIGFYLLFGVVRLNGSGVQDLGYAYHPGEPMQRLDLRRGGLEVSSATAVEYERLIGLVRRHSGGSRYIYATPDSPEVYFLSGFENPTKTLFEFLDPDPTNVPQLMQTLTNRRVNVVVINLHPPVSRPAQPALRAALQARYPDAVLNGRFEVRWRDAPPRS